MNTPAHLIFGAAAFARPGERKVTAAALLGALLPDVSLYAMAGWHLLVLGTDARVVFGQYYYSPEWMAVFSVDNSFLIWGALLGFALWLKREWAVALCGAALLHLALDFPLHAGDGRPHFWPLSDWIFDSPFSYWDRAHGAAIIGPLETLMCLAALVILWRRFATPLPRAAITTAAALQLSPVIIWMFVFGN
ncbi:hypothetical protein C8N43_1469 [Litoreibacter ponti]|uniref:LexA-binding, inner membrane-associated hydrolase n=1 Tax=Litoreibacter ponti TaxID=1510457 RepID=A0A2T6BL79_9RHOB|nr:cobalamin biosynthesis protein CobQ [Litoreibacter ponti]PTX56805.1 hypothetical protein C8N43_1469 [Litoreibacter ponti]